MSNTDYVKVLREIKRIENLFEDAATSEGFASGAKRGQEAEERVRALSPRIGIFYPGLYPCYKVDGEQVQGLSSAYEATLSEKDRGEFRHWRTLVNLVKRGTDVRITHFGNRHHVKLIIATPTLHDITWDFAKALGYRYSDKTGALIHDAAEQAIYGLALKLFPNHTTSAPAITWGWL